MKLKPFYSWRTLCITFIILLVVFETLVYVTTTPGPKEQFMQLYVLGPTQSTADYYPNNHSNINLGEQITWYLGVTNDMGSVQLISIRVKISNQTIQPPNETSALPSPAPAITEFPRFLQDNETWLTPFIWSITSAATTEGTTRILSLQINNETYQIPDSSATKGYNFRLIFELWTWQTDNNSFEFGWTTNNQHQTAWLQLWFNVTSTGPPN